LPLTQTRWPFFATLVIGGLAIATFAYATLANPRGEAVPASGGHYVEGVLRAPERINPLFAGTNQTDTDVASLVFSGLVRLRADGTPEPDLAERWEVSNNGQNYVFHLRNGVEWQDGEPFDAEDVVFTFRAIADPGFKGDAVLSQLMQGVVISERDPLTVEFKLEQTYAPFLTYLSVGILPKHLLAGLDPNQLFNAPFNARPIGTGPYVFGGQNGSGVQLTSNPTYYLGPPLVSTLEFRVFADATALAAAMRARAVDGALFSPNAQPDIASVVKGNPAYAAHQLASTSYFSVYMDANAPQFAQTEVRRALMQAINVQALIDDAAGAGVPAEVGIPRQSWAHSDVTLPPFDPGAAARALEYAGWSRGRDGVRRNDATRLSFTLSTTSDPRRVALAQDIAGQWRAIGADVTVQPLDASSYIDEVLLPRKFEAALVAVDPGPDPDPYPFWHSTQIPPPGRNLADHRDTRIDDVLQRGRQNTDPARRKELYELFAGYLIPAMPAIPLYAPTYTYAQSARVHGFGDTLLFTPAARFASAYQWYIATRRE
jgi:peptide/nickel transport system substrate-binding protein